MANDASKLSALDAEKADRAAASIRPSWDFDQADFEAPAAKADAFEKKLAEAPRPLVSTKSDAVFTAPVAASAVAPAPAPKTPSTTGSDIPRDTVIDGAPMVAVGRTIDIGPAPEDVKPAKPERAPPPARPQMTRMGLGDEVAAAEQSRSAPRPGEGPAPAAAQATTSNGTDIIPASSPAAAEAAAIYANAMGAAARSEDARADAPFAPGDVAEIAPLEARPEPAAEPLAEAPAVPAHDVLEPAEGALAKPPPSKRAAPEPIAPVAPSISRIEDPIEIPRKSSPLPWLIGGLVAIGAIVGGVVLLTGGDKTPASEPTAAQTATAKPTTEKPAAPTTATATATPATAEPPPATSAAPATSASAPASATAAAEPSAAPKPTTTTTAVATPTTPPKSTGTPPKPPTPKSTGTGGGIRRDTPF